MARKRMVINMMASLNVYLGSVGVIKFNCSIIKWRIKINVENKLVMLGNYRQKYYLTYF